MLAAALILVTAAVVKLSIVWVTRDVINSFTGHPASRSLNSAVVIVSLLLVFHAVLAAFHGYLIASVGHLVVRDFRIKLFEHLTTLSIGFFSKRRTGELISRLTSDIGVIQNFATNIPVNLTKQVVTFIGGMAILLYINWRLGLMILCVVPLITVTGMFFGRRLKKLSRAIQDRMAEVSTVLEEAVSGIRVVKSFLAGTYELNRFRKHVGDMTDTALMRAWMMSFFSPFIYLLTFLSAVGIVWYGAQQVQSGFMSPGDLVAFLLYGVVLFGPFTAFATLLSQIKEAQGATERVFEILDSHPEIADLAGAVALPPLAGRVAFHEVSFSYNLEREVLHNISLNVEPGSKVALVGPSGGGKSTLVQLLHRFYNPTKGRIEIDGHDIRKVTMDSLFRQIGFVPQETHLFGGSIGENILYGRPDADEEEIINAARAAHAHKFIIELPKAYDTIVGEKGMLLSAGQRQRITIARTILKSPRLLILDEATSSLDNESEALIQQALERLMAGCTTFIIAHRLSTIQKCDQIIVLNKGRIVERGNHVELMQQQGLYHFLYTMAEFELLK
jgi:subfamily B ATP-binding cassette protein MsbA